MFEQYSMSNNFGEENESNKVCPRCGISLYEILSTGSTGCAYCYEIFKNEIHNQVFLKQGVVGHTGKISSKHFSKIKIKEKIEALELEKEKAAKEENFIIAESLKNQIEKLKGEL